MFAKRRCTGPATEEPAPLPSLLGMWTCQISGESQHYPDFYGVTPLPVSCSRGARHDFGANLIAVSREVWLLLIESEKVEMEKAHIGASVYPLETSAGWLPSSRALVVPCRLPESADSLK